MQYVHQVDLNNKPHPICGASIDEVESYDVFTWLGRMHRRHPEWPVCPKCAKHALNFNSKSGDDFLDPILLGIHDVVEKRDKRIQDTKRLCGPFRLFWRLIRWLKEPM